jgi:hypothetical protein
VTSRRFPFELEDFLAFIVEVLKVRGDARAIAALVEGGCKVTCWESDYGLDRWRLFVALPVPLFHAMTEDERRATEAAIDDAASPFFAVKPDDALESVKITPQVVQANEG